MIKNNKDYLITDRLILRKFKAEDAQEMFLNWANDPEVTKYMTWNRHEDVDETKRIINLWLEEYKKPDTVRFGITIKETGELIGSIDVVRVIDGLPEVGYCSAKKCWNHGYMTEACNAITNYLFEIGYKAIIIEAEINNVGSNRVAIKCGYQFTHQETKIASPFKKYQITVNWYKKTI